MLRLWLTCCFALTLALVCAQDISLNQYLADWKHHDGYYVREVVSMPGMDASDIFHN